MRLVMFLPGNDGSGAVAVELPHVTATLTAQHYDHAPDADCRMGSEVAIHYITPAQLHDAIGCSRAQWLEAAREFERAVKAYSAWNTRPQDEYEQRKYDAMKQLFIALAAAEGEGE